MAAPTAGDRNGERQSALITLGTLAVAGCGVVGILLAGGDSSLVYVWLGGCGLGGMSVGHLVQGRQLSATTTQVQHTAEQLQEAIGPTNGDNIKQVLDRLEGLANDVKSGFDAAAEQGSYQRGRNHDVLNALTPVSSGVDTIVRQQQAITRGHQSIEKRLTAIENHVAALSAKAGG